MYNTLFATSKYTRNTNPIYSYLSYTISFTFTSFSLLNLFSNENKRKEDNIHAYMAFYIILIHSIIQYLY